MQVCNYFKKIFDLKRKAEKKKEIVLRARESPPVRADLQHDSALLVWHMFNSLRSFFEAWVQ